MNAGDAGIPTWRRWPTYTSGHSWPSDLAHIIFICDRVGLLNKITQIAPSRQLFVCLPLCCLGFNLMGLVLDFVGSVCNVQVKIWLQGNWDLCRQKRGIIIMTCFCYIPSRNFSLLSSLDYVLI